VNPQQFSPENVIIKYESITIQSWKCESKIWIHNSSDYRKMVWLKWWHLIPGVKFTTWKYSKDILNLLHKSHGNLHLKHKSLEHLDLLTVQDI